MRFTKPTTFSLRRPTLVSLTLWLVLTLVLVLASQLILVAHAASCTVGTGSYTTIQSAVNDTTCDTITVPDGTYTENVTISRDVTITGSTSGSTIVDGNNADVVFTINSGTVSLVNLTIQHGSSVHSSGAGVVNFLSGTLMVTNSTIRDNTTGYLGGGILTYGPTTISNSTFSGNNAANGGAIFIIGGAVTVTNSTFNGNHAGSYGGAIYNINNPANFLTVTNSTFSGNSAGVGGGLYNNGSGITSVTNSTFSSNSASQGGNMYNNVSPPYTGTLTLINTILANASSGGDCQVRETIATADSRNNLIEDANNTCGLTNGVNGNIIGQDPQLGPLANNGGPTLTHVPLPGSPVIDTGDALSCSATDQRGVARPYPAGGNCDIGAVEAVAGYGSAPAPGSPIAVGSSPVGVPILTTLTISETGELPLDVTGVSVSGSQASEFAPSPSSLHIANGAPPQSLTITCTPAAAGVRSATLNITHTASATPASYPLTCTGTSAELRVRTTINEPQPAPGQQVTYQLVVSNQGQASTSVSLADGLPAPLSVAGAATIEPSTGTSLGAFPLLLANQPLAAGAVLTITLPVKVPLGIAAGRVLVNTATLTGSGEVGSTQSAVALTVRDVAPLAGEDLSCTRPTNAIGIAVLRNDSDPNGQPLQIMSVATPAHGSAQIKGPTIIYTPHADFLGAETFSYTVSDGTLEATGSVRLSVVTGVGLCELFLPAIQQ